MTERAHTIPVFSAFSESDAGIRDPMKAPKARTAPAIKKNMRTSG